MRVRCEWGPASPGSIIATVVTVVFLSAEAANAQARRGAAAGPAVEAELVDGRVHRNDDAVTFRVAVLIPPGHHGYVDRGDDGFYIPFTFTIPALEEARAELTELARPQGVRDEKVNAFVLRGRGEFEFGLRPVAALSAINELEVTLRYQVWNDRTGICYPPTRVSIRVPLT